MEQDYLGTKIMTIKRLTSDRERAKNKELNLKKYRGRQPQSLNQNEINDLVLKIAEKMKLL